MIFDVSNITLLKFNVFDFMSETVIVIYLDVY